MFSMYSIYMLHKKAFQGLYSRGPELGLETYHTTMPNRSVGGQ